MELSFTPIVTHGPGTHEHKFRYTVGGTSSKQIQVGNTTLLDTCGNMIEAALWYATGYIAQTFGKRRRHVRRPRRNAYQRGVSIPYIVGQRYRHEYIV